MNKIKRLRIAKDKQTASKQKEKLAKAQFFSTLTFFFHIEK
jgi:hypothetical protein